jgi:hypothetical protein
MVEVDPEELVDHLVVLDVRGELDVAVAATLVLVGAELVHLDGKGQLRCLVGVDPVEVDDHREHVGTREGLVHVELGCDRTDQLLVGEGIGEAVLGHRGRQHPQEFMVAADAGQVALVLVGPVGGIRRRHPGRLVLEMPGPDHLKGVEAVEAQTSRGEHLEA